MESLDECYCNTGLQQFSASWNCCNFLILPMRHCALVLRSKEKKSLITIPGSVQAPVWYWLVWPASCFFSLPAVTVTDDSVRDIADCLDAGREEMWEKSLPNKQVTFLVYREGDQLNFFRVVDRGDGTLTPVSESLRSVQRREITCQEEGTTLHSGSLF